MEIYLKKSSQNLVKMKYMNRTPEPLFISESLHILLMENEKLEALDLSMIKIIEGRNTRINNELTKKNYNKGSLI